MILLRSNGIEPDVFHTVLGAADRVRTNEGEPHGAVYALIPPHTDLAAVGYPLITNGATRGFIADNVCFMRGDIDKKLMDLLAFDGAHFIDGSSGTFLAIRCQMEPAGDVPPRACRLDGHGTKHNSSLRMTEVGPYVVVVRSDDGGIHTKHLYSVTDFSLAVIIIDTN